MESTLPEAPVNLKVLEVQSRHVIVTWSPPDTGSSSITRYVLQYFWSDPALGGKHRSDEVIVMNAKTSALLNNLQPRTIYGLAVLAENTIGRGYSSNTVIFTTKEEANLPNVHSMLDEFSKVHNKEIKSYRELSLYAANLERENERLQTKVEILKLKNRNLRSEHQSYKQSLQKIDKNLEQLERKLENLKQSLEKDVLDLQNGFNKEITKMSDSITTMVTAENLRLAVKVEFLQCQSAFKMNLHTGGTIAETNLNDSSDATTEYDDLEIETVDKKVSNIYDLVDKYEYRKTKTFSDFKSSISSSLEEMKKKFEEVLRH